MRDRLIRFSVLAFLGVSLVAVFLLASRPAASQGGAAKCFGCSADSKATPMKDGHPDFSGVWGGGGGAAPPPAPAAGAQAPPPAAAGAAGQQFQRDADGSILFDFNIEMGNELGCYSDDCQAANQPAYNDKYMAKVKAIAKTEFLGTTALDPTKDCKPAGVPRAGIAGTYIQTPQAIIVLRGDYTDRVIYIDGSDHPSDVEGSYMGDSRGHWDGNTLVVDTIGLNDDTWLGGGGANTVYTSIHSTKEHVIERYTRNGDVMTVETTVEDPEALTKPWVLPVRRANIDKTPGLDYQQPYFCDGGGISALMRDHYVVPSAEDKDYKFKCSAHRCDDPTVKKDCSLANKQNCGK